MCDCCEACRQAAEDARRRRAHEARRLEPLIAGGQGRSADDVAWDATAVAICAAALIAIIIAASIWRG